MLSLDGPFVRFGDWHRRHPRLQVIQRLEEDGHGVLLVRAGDTSAPARTLYIDEETGRVRAEAGMTHLDKLGRIGQMLVFDDFRDVSGMLLPFRTRIKLANPLIGTIVTTVTEVELGIELPEGVFELHE